MSSLGFPNFLFCFSTFSFSIKFANSFFPTFRILCFHSKHLSWVSKDNFYVKGHINSNKKALKGLSSRKHSCYIPSQLLSGKNICLMVLFFQIFKKKIKMVLFMQNHLYTFATNCPGKRITFVWNIIFSLSLLNGYNLFAGKRNASQK